ncbi:MAG: oxidoreductase [Rhodothermia bacterium]|nr:oxidoreductase [Rhodothermia bacterium]
MRALVVREKHGAAVAEVEHLSTAATPNRGDITVRVLYSSLNYKDALAITGKGKIIRGDYPFVPGIDLVGEVVNSEAGRYAAGDRVVATGWGIGEEHWGGFSEFARLRSEWLVPLPVGLRPAHAMGIGTAGFTAMLAVMSIEEAGVGPESGEVVVTGATGGVGSYAVHLLSRRGYQVVASTGKDAVEYLSGLGAARVIERDVLASGAERPLDSGIWAGAVDSVGGKTLEAILSQTRRHGLVAACGLAGGAELSTTVFPFILRGVTLAGIDSNTCPYDRRRKAWERLSREVDGAVIDEMTETIELDDLGSASQTLLAGNITGRRIVRVGREAS